MELLHYPTQKQMEMLKNRAEKNDKRPNQSTNDVKT
jgi:hypothetical protein